MPADFQAVLASLEEKKLFVTSLDRRIGQIYPISVWRENEKFFDSYREEMDAQGRVLVPPKLRRDLEFENQGVHLLSYRGHVQIYSDPVYQAMVGKAAQSASQHVTKLRQAGLK
jgi:MraZ protein, putative antitoxin-like